MLYAIEGTLIEKESLFVVIFVNGLSFRVFVPLSTHAMLPKINEQCRLYTELIIGEKMFKLYGFHTIDEKNLFNSLRKISKIGPQTAVSVLSSLSVEQFYRAISNKDEKILTTIPGIGKKTALSIIVEFSSKLPPQDEQENLNRIVYDAIDVLENMGFTKSHSANIVKTIFNDNPDISLENLIKESLRLSKRNVR